MKMQFRVGFTKYNNISLHLSSLSSHLSSLCMETQTEINKGMLDDASFIFNLFEQKINDQFSGNGVSETKEKIEFIT